MNLANTSTQSQYELASKQERELFFYTPTQIRRDENQAQTIKQIIKKIIKKTEIKKKQAKLNKSKHQKTKQIKKAKASKRCKQANASKQQQQQQPRLTEETPVLIFQELDKYS